jgi:nicotinate (nicotinamide) nucleotide adenylyltransferase
MSEPEVSSDGRIRVALLGGSFDPITDAHLKCAAEIVHCGVADEVWLVPCGRRDDKPTLRRTCLDRLLMCHLAVNTTFGSGFPVKVSDIELNEPKALPTWTLLQKIKRDRPDVLPLFVIGSDLVKDLRSWDEGARLWAEETFLVINRPDYSIEDQELPPHMIRLEAPHNQFTLVSQRLSSSEVRKRLAFGEMERSAIHSKNYALVEGLVPAAVLAHIIRYKLYDDQAHPPHAQEAPTTPAAPATPATQPSAVKVVEVQAAAPTARAAATAAQPQAAANGQNHA